MSRKNREQRIRDRAYFLSQQAGFPAGRDLDFWFQADQLEPSWWWRPGRLRTWLGAQKDTLATIQAIATVLALGVGALWTWWIFDPGPPRDPNLYVTQSAETKKLGQGLLLLHITFLLENTGKRPALLTCAAFIVSQVVPAKDAELSDLSRGARDVLKTPSPNWPDMKWKVDDSLGSNDFYVEVGNHAQYITDFILPDTIIPSDKSNGNRTEKLMTVQIYSNFQRAISQSRKCRRKPDGGIEGPGWLTTTLYDIPS